MREKYPQWTPELYEYLVDRGARQDMVLAELERETAAMGAIAAMQVAPDQGAFMTLLARAIGARRALEVGTFTGYSAICIARALPEDGELVCCELDPGYAEAARGWLERAGVGGRVEIRVGPAIETLEALPEPDAFDLAFVDADKAEYPAYYEAILPHLRQGGLLLLDNVLMGGRMLDSEPDENARIVDALNARISDDERVDIAMLGIADGLTVVRRR